MRISIEQAVKIWHQLEDALHGVSNYGGDTAEIYLYRFMPYSPVYAAKASSFEPQNRKLEEQAAKSCLELFKLFEEVCNCQLFVDGFPLSSHIVPFHRIAVRVKKNESD